MINNNSSYYYYLLFNNLDDNWKGTDGKLSVGELQQEIKNSYLCPKQQF